MSTIIFRKKTNAPVFLYQNTSERDMSSIHLSQTTMELAPKSGTKTVGMMS